MNIFEECHVLKEAGRWSGYENSMERFITITRIMVIVVIIIIIVVKTMIITTTIYQFTLGLQTSREHVITCPKQPRFENCVEETSFMVSGTNVQIWKIQNSTSGGVISYTLNILHGTTWTPQPWCSGTKRIFHSTTSIFWKHYVHCPCESFRTYKWINHNYKFLKSYTDYCLRWLPIFFHEQLIKSEHPNVRFHDFNHRLSAGSSLEQMDALVWNLQNSKNMFHWQFRYLRKEHTV